MNHRYALIWAEASSLYREMSAAEGWNDKDKIFIPSVTHYTNRVGLPTFDHAYERLTYMAHSSGSQLSRDVDSEYRFCGSH